MAKSIWNEDSIPDLKGKVVIITGSTSGIGKQGARILAEKNAKVILAVRNISKGSGVVKELKNKSPHLDLDVRELDLTSLDSVKAFTTGVLNDYDRLDTLINNAGIMFPPYGKTKDGFELQMGTNHLGHFALTGLLMPLLKNTKDSRIVATSSVGHRAGKINFGDINWETRKYSTNQAYGDSKLANLYFTYEFAHRYKDDKDAPIITAAHPGWTRSDLQRHSGLMRFLNTFFSQGPEIGILPSLRAAVDPKANSGDYFGPSRFFEMHGNPIKVKSNKRSHDAHAARKLWDISEQLTGVKY